MIIVGGGISGLYCVKELLDKPHLLAKRAIKSIIILEKCGKWGGRVDTEFIKIADADEREVVFKCEQGAMRFIYRNDLKDNPKATESFLSQLIQDLGMENDVQPFYMEPQLRKIQPQSHSMTTPNCNNRYFNGQHFTATEWCAAQNHTMLKNLFNLEREEETKSAGEIINDIYQKLLHHNKSKLEFHFPDTAEVILAQQDTKLLQEYEDSDYWAVFRNEFTWAVGTQDIPLNKFSLQSLLSVMGYSHECFMMMVQTLRFPPEADVGTALRNLMTFNVNKDNFYQFEKGCSSLVENLMEHFKKTSIKAGVRLEFKKNCTVMMVSGHEEGFSVTVETQLDEKSKTMDLSTKNVIMALPPKAIESILDRSRSEFCSINAEKITKICRSVKGVQCTKITFYYDGNWWNQVENTMMYGANVTSLPCCQVYPFYGEIAKVGCNGGPAALTIFCNVRDAPFWSSLQKLGCKFQSPLQGQNERLFPASEPVVTEAIRQFCKVFNMKSVPRPILTSYRTWGGNGEDDALGEEQYGYAVHFWGVGVDNYQIMKEVVQPMEGKNLFLCNEAWSPSQGWMEGSLQGARKAVEKLLRLDSNQ